jgi:hypothetical protein
LAVTQLSVALRAVTSSSQRRQQNASLVYQSNSKILGGRKLKPQCLKKYFCLAWSLSVLAVV